MTHPGGGGGTGPGGGGGTGPGREFLSVTALLMTPARRDPSCPQAIATTGGPATFQLPQAKGLPQFDGPERRRLLSLL